MFLFMNQLNLKEGFLIMAKEITAEQARKNSTIANQVNSLAQDALFKKLMSTVNKVSLAGGKSFEHKVNDGVSLSEKQLNHLKFLGYEVKQTKGSIQRLVKISISWELNK